MILQHGGKAVFVIKIGTRIIQVTISIVLALIIWYFILVAVMTGVLWYNGDSWSDGPRDHCPHYPDCSVQ